MGDIRQGGSCAIERIQAGLAVEDGWGPADDWQRYEEATMCQRRPTDPTNPGNAADLSMWGIADTPGSLVSCGRSSEAGLMPRNA
jgi:hypothetical protein